MKPQNFCNLIIPLLLVACLIFTSLVTTACPKQSTVDKAINASEQIEAMSQVAASAADMAFAENLITPEQNSVLAPKLKLLADGAGAFKAAVNVYKLNSPNFTGGGAGGTFSLLNVMFTDQVLTPFLSVLTDLKLVKNIPKVLTAIGVIRVGVLLISQFFGKTKAVAQINRLCQESDVYG